MMESDHRYISGYQDGYEAGKKEKCAFTDKELLFLVEVFKQMDKEGIKAPHLTGVEWEDAYFGIREKI